MLTMDIMVGTLIPQAGPLLTVGAGALVAMVAFLALALVAAVGTARELGTIGREVGGAQRAVRLAEPRRLAA